MDKSKDNMRIDRISVIKELLTITLIKKLLLIEILMFNVQCSMFIGCNSSKFLKLI